MTTRKPDSDDIPAIINLFQQSVQHATAQAYNEEQRAAWVARGADATRWQRRVATQHFLLAEQSDQLLGFGSITSEGYLDVLYVHHAHQGEGSATLLLTALETWASGKGNNKITTHASLTARPFFEKNDYKLS